jgi:hypothetical protein
VEGHRSLPGHANYVLKCKCVVHLERGFGNAGAGFVGWDGAVGIPNNYGMVGSGFISQ